MFNSNFMFYITMHFAFQKKDEMISMRGMSMRKFRDDVIRSTVYPKITNHRADEIIRGIFVDLVFVFF